MISIIVCSVKPFFLEKLKASVATTVGIPYEMIVIDNSVGHYSLTKAYNEGGRQAKFEHLLFLHEDVLFETTNWGAMVVRHLSNLPKAGIIGIAGGRYKSRIPSLWIMPDEKDMHLNIVHVSRTTGKVKPLQLNCHQAQPVCVLDGVFLGMKKNVFLTTPFDEKLPGFHQYDMDICIAASQHFTNYFIPDVLLHHFSEGNADETWIRNGMQLFYKWKDVLPIDCRNKGSFAPRIEVNIFDDFLIRLFGSRLSLREKLQYSTVVYGYVLAHGKGTLSATRILVKKWGKLLLKGRLAWAN